MTNDLTYISLFSGIGGLEHPEAAPVLVCESDPDCQVVLRRQYPNSEIWPDVETLDPPPAQMIVGGWPCQDLSSAGLQTGLSGVRSSLFFEMLRVAKDSGAETIIGENVPNLLSLKKGADFAALLRALTDGGYPFVAWRVINARSFGLPQDRKRLFIVASKTRECAEAIHARLPHQPQSIAAFEGGPAGFYWTGGKRSICFSEGFVPALKIGATDDAGRSPVAVLIDGRVRKLNLPESLRLQGLSHLRLTGVSRSAALRMTGNAVAAPVGRFVVESVSQCASPAGNPTKTAAFTPSGLLLRNGEVLSVQHKSGPMARNLDDFLDRADKGSLSAQAAAGLIVRSVRSGLPMPRELFDALADTAMDREGGLRPSRSDSFAALDGMQAHVSSYAQHLPRMIDSRRGRSRLLRTKELYRSAS
ncbi:DNA (cytosine-5-)-methyltransferase [Geodermatophilus sp. YIM 151500]|uniref:DNA cytosine methyltransferase n=1 Tax=Geodermatophilus sp. YIM 151500 TaxID=2984531 RepID=UPI0021E3B8CD|nr:DNA (cytosine-5-)-methyltransferase [Geodermatophilus sp. YIM 151500]MCV2488248.1 DNA (cytosine-5-)-methyltransferase [Geodermatophilus sp. YIM 151500]